MIYCAQAGNRTLDPQLRVIFIVTALSEAPIDQSKSPDGQRVSTKFGNFWEELFEMVR